MAKPYDDIELGRHERVIIHLFDFYDQLEAIGLRDYFTPSPSAFTSHFKREKPQSRREKLDVMRRAKEQKTRHLIYAKQTRGRIPWRMVRLNWTMCGWARLLVAYMH